MRVDFLGWTDFFERSFILSAGTLRAGRVASENRGHYVLWTENGEITAKLLARHSGEYPVTGDWVGVDDNGMVRTVLPRKTKVSRKRAGRTWEEQVLAANIDVLFLVTGLDQDFNERRLERYLILSKESGARAVIVLNKSDLCDDPLEKLRITASLAPAVPSLICCAFDPSAVAQLSRHIEPGETAALLGSSGAGKSTLVNSLLGRQVQPVNEVRNSDGRGRHTTTNRQLFLLEAGWLVIDTPGLRELEPWASVESAEAVFADVLETAAECRFRDCRHQGEPGCAVASAIEEGSLDSGRMESFSKMRREMMRLEMMSNANAAREEKRRVKSVHKLMRNFSKEDRR